MNTLKALFLISFLCFNTSLVWADDAFYCEDYNTASIVHAAQNDVHQEAAPQFFAADEPSELQKFKKLFKRKKKTKDCIAKPAYNHDDDFYYEFDDDYIEDNEQTYSVVAPAVYVGKHEENVVDQWEQNEWDDDVTENEELPMKWDRAKVLIETEKLTEDLSKYGYIEVTEIDGDVSSVSYEYEAVDEQSDSQLISVKLNASTGYRKDEVAFNIASDITGTATPNIISELTWTDLESRVVTGQAEIVLLDHYVIDASAAYADIADGKNQDSDFFGDNRTFEFSRSISDGDGDILDLNGGIGYRVHVDTENDLFNVDSLDLTVLGGYGYSEQNLQINDGFFVIPANGGSLDGLGSSYDTEWKGPWAGLEVSGEQDKITGSLRFQYHWAEFDAEANWSLRTDFQHPVSFIHEADGRGLLFRGKVGYHLTDFLTLDFIADYQNWKTDPGVITFFLSNGTTPQQRLNEVTWDSYSLTLGATAHF